MMGGMFRPIKVNNLNPLSVNNRTPIRVIGSILRYINDFEVLFYTDVDIIYHSGRDPPLMVA